MTHLCPTEFIAAMLGVPIDRLAPPLPRVNPPRFAPGRNVPEPSNEEVAAVDEKIMREQLRLEGVYLGPASFRAYVSDSQYRALIAETNDCLWMESNRRSGR